MPGALTSPDAILACLRSGELERAARELKARGIAAHDVDLGGLRSELSECALVLERGCDFNAAARARRRLAALDAFSEHGFAPARVLAPVVLPDPYHGKFMLMRLSGSWSQIVLLRGGDEWHREILKATESELRDLGFADPMPRAAGGGWVSIDGASFELWGTSEEYGECDKSIAAALLGAAFGAPSSRRP